MNVKQHRHWIRKKTVTVLKFWGMESLDIKIRFRRTHPKFFASASKTNITFYLNRWDKLSYLRRREILVHELCHVVAENKKRCLNDWHGRYWQNLMYSAGYEPIVAYDWILNKD